MIFFPPQAALVPTDLDTLFSKNLPPFSRPQPALQGGVAFSLDNIPLSRIRALLALSDSPQEKNAIAANAVDTMLREIAGHLNDSEQRQRFSKEGLSERERTRVLGFARSGDLTHFIEQVAQLAESDSAVKSYLNNKLNNALNYTNVAERATIIKNALEKKNGENLVLGCMRASESFAELKSLVQAVGDKALLKCSMAEIKDLTAYVVLAPKVRDATIPALLTQTPTKENLKTLEKAWQTALDNRIGAINSNTECSSTSIAKRWQSIFEYEKKFVQAELKAAKKDPERCEVLNAALLRLEISSIYALKISDSDMLVAGAGKWASAELGDLKTTLGDLNSAVLLSTPLLTEIQRASMPSRPNVLGARYGNGVIRVFDATFGSREIEVFYPKVSSLQVVLTHELGHAIQLGKDGGGVVGDHYSPGEVSFDFDEFVRLGGWAVYLPDSYEITNSGASVKIEGKEYPIDRPVKFHGELVTFLFDGWQLSSYKSAAPFSLRWYSRTTPWEDWAEGFAEYNLMPERLITFAPEKFQYFEDEFGRYSDRKDLQKLLDQSLRQQGG